MRGCPERRQCGYRAAGLAAVTLLSLCLPGLAVAEDWSQLGPPGGDVRRLAPTTDGSPYTLLAATRQTLFARTPEPQWVAIGPNYYRGAAVISDLVMAEADPGRIMMLLSDPYGGTEIFRTLDGGDWSTVRLPIPPEDHYCYCVEFHPDDPNIVFVGSYFDLWRSDDAGDTWQAINVGLPDHPIPTDFLVLPGAEPALLFSSRGDHPGVYRSEDWGDSWVQVFADTHISQLVRSPDNSQEVFAVYQAGIFTPVPQEIYRSVDGGRHWESWCEDARLGQGLVVDPANPDYHYILGDADLDSTMTDVMASEDRGQTWFPAARPEVANGESSLYALGFTAPFAEEDPDLYVATNIQGVWRSEDHGSNWTLDPLMATYLDAVAVGPGTPGHLYVGTADAPYLTHQNGLLYVSEDHGESWPVTGASNDSNRVVGRIHALSPSPSIDDRVWVATEYGLFSSDDAGVTLGWHAYGHVRDVWEDPYEQDHILYCRNRRPPHYGPEIRESWDAGVGWSTLHEFGANPNRLLVDDQGGRIYVALDSGLEWSDDGGTNWTGWDAAPGFPVSDLVIDPLDAAHLYAATEGGGVLESTDRGLGWNAMNNELGELDVRALIQVESAGRDRVSTKLVAGTGRGCYFWNGLSWEYISDGVVSFPSSGDSIALRTTGLAYDQTEDRLYVTTAGRSCFRLDGLMLSAVDEHTPLLAQTMDSYPNPFNPRVCIRFTIPPALAGQRLSLRIFDLAGRLLATPWRQQADAGTYAVVWDGRDQGGRMLSSGTYLCQLQGAGVEMNHRLLLLR